MFEKTHARIAKEIARELELSKEQSDLLESGSTRPDSYIEFPHHKGKEDLIFADIIDARALFLNNDDEAFVKLGEACHFIADKWTLKPRIDVKHFQYEESIESCSFQDDDKFAQEIEQSVIPSKSKVYYKDLIGAIKELLVFRDFTVKKSLITELAEKKAEELSPKQVSFLNTCLKKDSALVMKYLMLSKYGAEEKSHTKFTLREYINECIPFPLISHLAWVSREGTEAENYSTPAIDLNISLRLSLAASCFVLSKKDVTMPQKILNWNKLCTNWKEELNDNIDTSFHETDNAEDGNEDDEEENEEVLEVHNKLCWHCGSEIKENHLFCGHCGKPLK